MLRKTADRLKPRSAFLTQEYKTKLASTLPLCAAQFYECRLLPFVHSSQKNFSQFTVLSHHCLWRLTSCNAGGVTS